MDESFDGLDMVVRAAVKETLIDRVAQRKMTVVATSHNLYEIEEMCDHVAIIHRGKLVLERDLDQLKEEFVRVQAAFSKPLEMGWCFVNGNINLDACLSEIFLDNLALGLLGSHIGHFKSKAIRITGLSQKLFRFFYIHFTDSAFRLRIIND